MSSQVQQVKEVTDIVQVVGERISLQKAGRSYRASCPFHGEKSPSFYVHPELQIFRCFGCGEKGDVFTFVQKFDGLTFAESLKMFAEKAGIVLEQTQFTSEDKHRDKLLAIMQLTKEYYHYLLTEHRLGEPARQYLKKRGVSQDTIRVFQLGYSLPSWDGLIKYLIGKKQFSVKELSDAGLIIPRGNASAFSTEVRDFYDRFRGRLMFPLSDHRGRVVGFSGRVLNPEEKTAKYINSPETALYHKSRLLFGFSQLYQSIRQADSVIIVEGEFDVISSYQAHVKNVVAIKGSALTKEHVELLKRTVDTVVLALDADSAGVEATKRAIDLVHVTEMRLRVLPLAKFEGKDPDDIAREKPGDWREAVKQSVSSYEFLMDASFAQHDEKTGEGKHNIVKELAPVLNSIPHAVEQAHYIATLARRLNVSEEILRQDLRQTVRVRSKTSTQVESEEQKIELSLLEKTERLVLYTVLHRESNLVVAEARAIDGELFTHPSHRLILQQIVKNTSSHKSSFDIAKFLQKAPAELQSVISDIYFDQPQEYNASEQELKQAVQRLQTLHLQDQIDRLTEQLEAIEHKEGSENESEQQEILQQIVQLRAKMVKY